VVIAAARPASAASSELASCDDRYDEKAVEVHKSGSDRVDKFNGVKKSPPPTQCPTA
jgi:hypothetical protein